MDGQNSYDDELARRRAVREQQVKGQTGGSANPEPDDASDEEMPKFTAKDILAMVLAAYQVLLPFFLIIVVALLVVYFLFQYVFS